MEKNKELHTNITYDFTKTIVDIEINPAYIHGLQRICNNFIIDSDRHAEMPDIFKKFNDIVEQHGNPELDQTPIPLDQYESDIYTLFSLIQLLKYKAKIQDLEIKTETTVTKEELAALAKIIEKGEDATEALAKINEQMTTVK